MLCCLDRSLKTPIWCLSRIQSIKTWFVRERATLISVTRVTSARLWWCLCAKADSVVQLQIPIIPSETERTAIRGWSFVTYSGGIREGGRRSRGPSVMFLLLEASERWRAQAVLFNNSTWMKNISNNSEHYLAAAAAWDDSSTCCFCYCCHPHASFVWSSPVYSRMWRANGSASRVESVHILTFTRSVEIFIWSNLNWLINFPTD